MVLNSLTSYFPPSVIPLLVSACGFVLALFFLQIVVALLPLSRAQARNHGSNRAVSGPVLVFHRPAAVGVKCLSFLSAKGG